MVQVEDAEVLLDARDPGHHRAELVPAELLARAA